MANINPDALAAIAPYIAQLGSDIAGGISGHYALKREEKLREAERKRKEPLEALNLAMLAESLRGQQSRRLRETETAQAEARERQAIADIGRRTVPSGMMETITREGMRETPMPTAPMPFTQQIRGTEDIPLGIEETQRPMTAAERVGALRGEGVIGRTPEGRG